MTSKTATPTLRKIFSDILSDMAFIFVSEPDSEVIAPGYTLQARIRYQGTHRGMLQLRCDGRFAAILAGNLLGVDSADAAAEQQRLDALKELMNVVCGNLVTTLYGTEALFELTIPEITPLLPGDRPESLQGAEAHTFLAENYLIELAHRVE
jgi:CheY-specific phosphatase CheX